MSIIKALLALIFLSSVAQAQSWKDMVLINGCQILDLNGDNLKTFPGSFCQFLENGNYLSASEDKIKLMSKTHATIWEKDGHYHHQLNLSHDNSKILALSSSPYGKVREDKFQIFSMDGKLLHEMLSSEYQKQIKDSKPFSRQEQTHFNSFYEIPPLDPEVKLPDYIKAGNLVLNAYRSGLFIVSPDLKKVLHHMKFTNSLNNQTHDVQILPNGKMIYFNNESVDSAEGNSYSSVDEIDLVTGKTTVLFTATPKQMFFSRHCGGVQYLDKDHLLFSHMLSGTYIYSLKENKILSNIYRTHLIQTRFYPTQQVKAQNLKKFMSNWK